MGVQKRLIEERWWGKGYASGRKTVWKNADRVAFDKELEIIFRKFDMLRKTADSKHFERIMGQAAIPAREAMKNAAPISKKPHRIKDDGGKMKLVKPGNLKKSVQIFKGKKTGGTVLVGPVVSKKSKVFSVEGVKKVTRRHRAFYYKFTNFGTVYQSPTRFIDKAREASRAAVKTKLKAGAKRYLSKEIAKLF